MFCCFVDIKRAFDTVWREGLFYKLNLFDINGKCLRLIKNMYLDIKSCVTVNGERSMLFPCEIGVRQGENLSLLLFLIYLNDLEEFLSQSSNVNGISFSNDDVDENARIFLKLFVLLYADDTVILADTAEDLQNALIISYTVIHGSSI